MFTFSCVATGYICNMNSSASGYCMHICTCIHIDPSLYVPTVYICTCVHIYLHTCPCIHVYPTYMCLVYISAHVYSYILSACSYCPHLHVGHIIMYICIYMWFLSTASNLKHVFPRLQKKDGYKVIMSLRKRMLDYQTSMWLNFSKHGSSQIGHLIFNNCWLLADFWLKSNRKIWWPMNTDKMDPGPL